MPRSLVGRRPGRTVRLRTRLTAWVELVGQGRCFPPEHGPRAEDRSCVPASETVENFGRIGLVDHIIVQAGPLAAPGEWLSEAPHLVRAILDDRVRIRGLPRHKGRYIGRPGTRGSTTRTPQETLVDRSSRPRTLRPRHLERRSDPRRTSKYRGKPPAAARSTTERRRPALALRFSERRPQLARIGTPRPPRTQHLPPVARTEPDGNRPPSALAFRIAVFILGLGVQATQSADEPVGCPG